MKSSVRSEGEIRKLLRALPDSQLKKLAGGIDVSPFPVLIALEFERRFGRDRSPKARILARIRASVLHEQRHQSQLIDRMRKEADAVGNSRISEKGLDSLSEESVLKLQARRAAATAGLLKHAESLSRSVGKIESLEAWYLRLQD